MLLCCGTMRHSLLSPPFAVSKFESLHFHARNPDLLYHKCIDVFLSSCESKPLVHNEFI